jgi:hypothetical protein
VVKRLRLRRTLLPSRVDVSPRPVGSAPSLHPRYRASSLRRADPSRRSASVLGPRGFRPLGLLPCHRSARFPRSAWRPEPSSHRLSAGHRPTGRQVPAGLYPWSPRGTWFRWHLGLSRQLVDGSLAFAFLIRT